MAMGSDTHANEWWFWARLMISLLEYERVDAVFATDDG